MHIPTPLLRSTGYTDLVEPPFLPRLHILAGTANNLTHSPNDGKGNPYVPGHPVLASVSRLGERPSTQDLLVRHGNAALAERNKGIQQCRTKKADYTARGGREGRGWACGEEKFPPAMTLCWREVKRGRGKVIPSDEDN